MGGRRDPPSPPPGSEDDLSLQWTLPGNDNSTKVDPPAGSGLGCYGVPNLPVGTVLNPSFLGCDPGWYCPNLDPNDPATIPVFCPPSPNCAILRLGGLTCSAQGKYEPIVCIPGRYCPNYKTMLTCPAGYFCPSGTVKPYPCGFLTMCPPGSVTQLPYGPIVLMIILDGILTVILVSIKIRQGFFKQLNASELIGRFLHGASWTLAERARMQAADHEYAKKAAASVGIDEGPRTPLAVSTANPDELMRLVQAFTAAFGHRELRMNFKFDGLALSLPNGKKVLEGVTGEIKSKRMTAIIGPSGAGKTTFMNVLMGKVARTGGRLHINGAEAEMHLYRKIIGYVPQEDIMLRELTVREVVLHSARVRLPRKWTQKQVEDHVDNVLSALNLSHVANSFIGDETTRGVSGGQRKRVNIGMELAAGCCILPYLHLISTSAPLAIFLDEPTSGLDSTAALEVADILQNIAHLGLTIVSVIHQPRIEIFRKFDDVLMIAPGGRVAYLGPVSQSQRYFEALGFDFEPGINMSDVLMDILSGKANHNRFGMGPKQLVAAWEKRKNREYPLEAPIAPTREEADVSSTEGGSSPLSVMMRGSKNLDSPQNDPNTYESDSLPAKKRSIENVDRWLVNVDGVEVEPVIEADSIAVAEPVAEVDSIAVEPNFQTSEEDTVHGFKASTTEIIIDTDNHQNVASQPTEVNTVRRNLVFGPRETSRPIFDQNLSPVDADSKDAFLAPSPSQTGFPPRKHRDSNISINIPAHSYYQGNSIGQFESGSEQGSMWRKPPRVNSHQTLAPTIVESIRNATQGGGDSPADVDDETARMDYEFHSLVPQVVMDRGAPIWRQVWYCHMRSLTQQSRAVGALALEIFVAMFAGFLMGISTSGKVKELFTGIYISPYSFFSPAPQDLLSLYGLLLGIGIALAGAPSGVKVFGEEKPVYWREAASGHSKLAYYLGKTLASVYRICLTSLHFAGLYAYLAKPIIDVYTQYLLILLQFWGVYGMSCIISLVVRRENASLLSVVVGLFAAVFNGYGPNLSQANKWGIIFIFELSFNKWASEVSYALGTRPYKHVYNLEQSKQIWGYSTDQVSKGFIMCFLLGLLSRTIGFVLLIFLHRDKQK